MAHPRSGGILQFRTSHDADQASKLARELQQSSQTVSQKFLAKTKSILGIFKASNKVPEAVLSTGAIGEQEALVKELADAVREFVNDQEDDIRGLVRIYECFGLPVDSEEPGIHLWNAHEAELVRRTDNEEGFGRSASSIQTVLASAGSSSESGGLTWETGSSSRTSSDDSFETASSSVALLAAIDAEGSETRLSDNTSESYVAGPEDNDEDHDTYEQAPEACPSPPDASSIVNGLIATSDLKGTSARPSRHYVGAAFGDWLVSKATPLTPACDGKDFVMHRGEPLTIRNERGHITRHLPLKPICSSIAEFHIIKISNASVKRTSSTIVRAGGLYPRTPQLMNSAISKHTAKKIVPHGVDYIDGVDRYSMYDFEPRQKRETTYSVWCRTSHYGQYFLDEIAQPNWQGLGRESRGLATPKIKFAGSPQGVVAALRNLDIEGRRSIKYLQLRFTVQEETCKLYPLEPVRITVTSSQDVWAQLLRFIRNSLSLEQLTIVVSEPFWESTAKVEDYESILNDNTWLRDVGSVKGLTTFRLKINGCWRHGAEGGLIAVVLEKYLQAETQTSTKAKERNKNKKHELTAGKLVALIRQRQRVREGLSGLLIRAACSSEFLASVVREKIKAWAERPPYKLLANHNEEELGPHRWYLSKGRWKRPIRFVNASEAVWE